MKQIFLVVLLSLPPLTAFPAELRALTLQVGIVRNGSTLCAETKRVLDGEEVLFCDGPSAIVKVTGEILPRGEEAARRGDKEQVKVSAKVEALNPRGWKAEPMIVALDGERAEISSSEVSKEGVTIDSFRMAVTPWIL